MCTHVMRSSELHAHVTFNIYAQSSAHDDLTNANTHSRQLNADSHNTSGWAGVWCRDGNAQWHALVHIVRRMRSANAWMRVWCINMFLCLCNYCSLRQQWWDIVRLSVFITVERSSVWRPSPDVRLRAELIITVAEWKQSFFLEMFYIVQDYTVFFSSFASPYELRLNLHAYTIESSK